MFTGIAHGAFQARVKRRDDGITELKLKLGNFQHGLVRGASVAINGVCLTVVEVINDDVSFEIGSETARISNLGQLRDFDYVNVERSLKFGDEIGGHILSGHIAAKVEVTAVTRASQEAQISFRIPTGWCDYVMHKGFIALNGCSLTVAEFDRESGIGAVNLIPETLRLTTFNQVQVGDQLNLEVDSQTQALVNTVKTVLADRDWLKSMR